MAARRRPRVRPSAVPSTSTSALSLSPARPTLFESGIQFKLRGILCSGGWIYVKGFVWVVFKLALPRSLFSPYSLLSANFKTKQAQNF